ncbi:hypothetical protein G6F42_017011 [Rhizopus arrhizus]|nr:hypothetical protein G6F42_017011 [Rhizopus arrhizus]
MEDYNTPRSSDSELCLQGWHPIAKQAGVSSGMRIDQWSMAKDCDWIQDISNIDSIAIIVMPISIKIKHGQERTVDVFFALQFQALGSTKLYTTYCSTLLKCPQRLRCRAILRCWLLICTRANSGSSLDLLMIFISGCDHLMCYEICYMLSFSAALELAVILHHHPKCHYRFASS